MKRIIIIVVTILWLIAIVSTWSAITHKTIVIKGENTAYTLTARIVEIDKDNDIVTCEDNNGESWMFDGCEDWQEGDCVELLMCDNGTQSIYDDEIIRVRYVG